MNNEFKRLQELAGIKEITIGNPLPLKNLTVGDKLRVVKEVYNTPAAPNITIDSRVNMIQTTEPTPRSRVPDYLWVIGEVWRVESTDGLGIMKCISDGGNYNHINNINIEYTQNLIDMGVFKYENRLQELAGIKEIIVGNPLTINVEKLKKGDKLKVIKTVYWDQEGKDLSLTPQPGEYGAFIHENDVWEVRRSGTYIVLKCIQSDNDPYSVGNEIGSGSIVSLSKLGAFNPIKKSEIKEITINNPIPIKYDDLKIGDKLRVTKDVYYNRYSNELNFERGDQLVVASGDIWKIEGTGPFWGQLKCIQSEEHLGDIIGVGSFKKLIDMGAFTYDNK